MTRRRHKYGPSEADTLKAISDYCEVKGILYLRINPISPVNSGKGLRFRAVRPSQRGAPDLLVFWGVKMPKVGWTLAPIAVEVKSPIGKQSEDQKRWELAAMKVGMTYRVVRSLEEFLEVLR